MEGFSKKFMEDKFEDEKGEKLEFKKFNNDTCRFAGADLHNSSIEEIQKEYMKKGCVMCKGHGLKSEKQMKIIARLRNKLKNK